MLDPLAEFRILDEEKARDLNPTGKGAVAAGISIVVAVVVAIALAYLSLRVVALLAGLVTAGLLMIGMAIAVRVLFGSRRPPSR